MKRRNHAKQTMSGRPTLRAQLRWGPMRSFSHGGTGGVYPSRESRKPYLGAAGGQGEAFGDPYLWNEDTATGDTVGIHKHTGSLVRISGTGGGRYGITTTSSVPSPRVFDPSVFFGDPSGLGTIVPASTHKVHRSLRAAITIFTAEEPERESGRHWSVIRETVGESAIHFEGAGHWSCIDHDHDAVFEGEGPDW